jgi:hypothetical protein
LTSLCNIDFLFVHSENNGAAMPFTDNYQALRIQPKLQNFNMMKCASDNASPSHSDTLFMQSYRDGDDAQTKTDMIGSKKTTGKPRG